MKKKLSLFPKLSFWTTQLLHHQDINWLTITNHRAIGQTKSLNRADLLSESEFTELENEPNGLV